MQGDTVGRSAVLRPIDSEVGAGRTGPHRRRPRREMAAWLLLAGLIAVAGLALGLVLADGFQDDGLGPGMRPATPEEVASATGSGTRADVDEPSRGDPGAEHLAADGSQDQESLDAEEGPAAGSTPTSDESLALPLPVYPAPAVADEPVVAVAEAVSPSVVLVEVEAVAGFGLGSGIVWDAENGYIVTNQHVVEGADSVAITLSDGTRLDGEVIGGSAGHDVAVVSVDPEAAELVAATFAPVESVRVGQLAVAIGSPLGLTGTVTAGIVSAVRMQIFDPNSPVPVEMIQTDAAINRGNSGGALADWQGRVVGMNTLIHTTSGGSIGLGFAVPSDIVELIATRIVNGESLELGYLGITSDAGEGDDLGVVIAEILPGSPAEEAGLLVGDVIISLDGEPMYEITQLSAAIKLHRPGETVELTVRRDGDIYVATAVLAALG